MLIKLTDTKGNIVYVNPDHVVFVGNGSSGGSPVVGETAVMVAGIGALAIAGSPGDVAAQIGGKEPGSCLML